MKKSVLTVLFALFCTMSFAQLSFNVKAGTGGKHCVKQDVTYITDGIK